MTDFVEVEFTNVTDVQSCASLILESESPEEIYALTQSLLESTGYAHLRGMCLSEAAHELIGSSESKAIGDLMLAAAERWEVLVRADD